jgi:hypothetical protein
MIRAGSIRTGMDDVPSMDLTYECTIFREQKSYFASGSQTQQWTEVGGAVPCDVSPLSDEISLSQSGQIEKTTHVLHFSAGTNILARDSIQITYSRSTYGDVGMWFFLTEVMRPSELISYVRAHATAGKQPTAGGDS